MTAFPGFDSLDQEQKLNVVERIDALTAKMEWTPCDEAFDAFCDLHLIMAACMGVSVEQYCGSDKHFAKAIRLNQLRRAPVGVAN